MTRRVGRPQDATIAGPAGAIEALVDRPDGAPRAIAVICHPHPLQHGTMQNKVVATLARAFSRIGAVAVRFNFRGVGRSDGQHADGIGERDDALAVIAWSREQWPGLPIYLAGFSFGALVALTITARVAPGGLVTVAPPIARLPKDFAPPECRWLLIQGDSDEVVPPDQVLAWVATLRSPPTVRLFSGAGHFFHGRLSELTRNVDEFFGPAIAAV